MVAFFAWEKKIKPASQANATTVDKLVRAAPYLLFFGLTGFVAIVHLLYDGRVLLDHDLFFYKQFLSANSIYLHCDGIYNTVFDYFTNYTNESCYILPNLMLQLAAGLVHIDLYFLRAFNLPFFLLFLLGSYKIGEILANRTAGWLCAVAAASLPIFDVYSRSFDFHFHAMAFITWANVILLQEFSKPSSWRRYALLGTCLGLAILTHTISLLESAPIFVFAFINLMRHQGRNIQSVTRLGILVLYTLVVALPIFIGLYDYSLAKARFVMPMMPFSKMNLTVLSPDYFNQTILDYVGFRFLIFYAVLAAISAYWLIWKKQFRFKETYLAVCILFYGALSLNILLNYGNRQDTIIFYTLIPPLLIASTYRFFAAGNGRQWGIALLTFALLFVGTLEKTEALQSFSLTRQPLAHEPYNDSRRWLSAHKDWMWKSVETLREMNVNKYARVEYQVVRVDDNGEQTTMENTDFVSIPLAYTAGLFRLQLDQIIADQKPRVRFEVFLLPDGRLPASTISALRRRLLQSPEEDIGEVRWRYFAQPIQNISLSVDHFLIIISTTKKAEAARYP